MNDKMNAGTLYIVATPIGNLQDISFRCVQILVSVDIILCEDTRRMGLLWQHIERILPMTNGARKLINKENKPHKPQFIPYYEQNEKMQIPKALNALENGLNVALVSDAGTPTISDPGFKLVRECIRQGIKVESIPGPSAAVTALTVSGLPTDKFLFLGYLPKRPGHRKSELESLKQMLAVDKKMQPTIIFYEAPHRLIQMFEELESEFGDVGIVVCRELTKVHEEIRREPVSKSLSHFKKIEPKGEFVILFNTKS